MNLETRFGQRPESNVIETSGQRQNTRLLGKVAEISMRLMTRRFEVEGKENIPREEALVIANHSSHIDWWAVAAALKDHNIGVVGRNVPDRTNAPSSVLRWLGMVGVREAASHLSLEERQLLRKTSNRMVKIIQREEDPKKRREDVSHNIRAMHQIVECLIQGRKMIYFPEGGFYKEADIRLRPVTKGVEIIAKLYKQKTRKDLLILPVGINGGHSVMGSRPEDYLFRRDVLGAIKKKKGEVTLRIGEPFFFSEFEDFNKVFQEHLGPLMQ